MNTANKGKNRKRLLIGLSIILGLLLLIVIGTSIIMMNAIIPQKSVAMPARVHEESVIAVSAGMNENNGAAKVIPVNGFDLWYKESGNPQGKPMVIIHGGPGYSSYYFQTYLDFLKDDYRVINYDQRGCGFSEFKSDPDLYTFDSLIEELDTIINEQVKAEKVILLGHSFGSTIALKYALDHPEKVEKLILVSNGFVKPHIKLLISYFSRLYKDSWPPIKDQEATDTWYQKRMPVVLSDTFYEPKNLDLLDLGYVSYSTMMSVLLSMGSGFSLEDQLAGFDKETLLIYGVNEVMTFSHEDQLILHQALKNSTLVQFKKSGHWTFMEEPDKFQQTVLSFLKE